MIRFDPAARQEFDDSIAGHRERSVHLALRFVAEVAEALQAISERPASFRIVLRLHSLHPIRRARLRKFPFALVFTAKDVDSVIVAVAHSKRRPLYWRERLESR